MRKAILFLVFFLSFSGTSQESKQMRSALNFFTPAPAASSAKHVEDDEVVALLHTGQGTIAYTRQGSAITSGLKGVGFQPYMETATKRTTAGQIEFADPLETRVNFIRRDGSAQVKAYGSLIYKDVWPGVDLRFSRDNGGVLPELLLSPNSDLSAVVLETGAANLRVLPDGGLSLEIGGRSWQLAAPNAVQQVQGKKQMLPVAFKALGEGRFGLEWQQKPVADAVVSFKGGTEQQVDWEWGALIGGGTNADGVFSGDRNFIQVDAQENMFLAGRTRANDFPVTQGALSTDLGDNHSDIFIAKLNSAGSAFEYCTYLGGDGIYELKDMVVNGQGEVFITGTTESANMPITQGAYATSLFGGLDTYVVKLNASGSDVIYGTFIGGSNNDSVNRITLDSSGRAVIVGGTNSSNYPTTQGSYQPSLAGEFDLFATKISADGSSLVYSTFIGGSNHDVRPAVILNSNDELFIAGTTLSSDFPVTENRIGSAPASSNTGIFGMKLSSDASTLLWGQTIGGDNNDSFSDMGLDVDGNLYLVGNTQSFDFPVTQGAYDTDRGTHSNAVFLLKIATDGTGLIFSSFFGSDSAISYLAIDQQGRAIICKSSNEDLAADFPEGYRSPLLQSEMCVLAKFNETGSALEFSAFFSGEDDDNLTDIALDANDNIYIIGRTFSYRMPTTAGAFNTTLAGSVDIFLAKFTANGEGLTYSSYIHEGEGEVTPHVEVDSQDRAVLVTSLSTSTFPVTQGAYDTVFNGGYDIVVLRFANDGQSLEFVTYLGGTNVDFADDLVLGPDDSVFILGRTFSEDFPLSSNAYQQIHSIGTDAFVVKLSADGSQLDHATYLGGHGQDAPVALALSNAGDIFVAGRTHSENFPVTPNAYDRIFSIGQEKGDLAETRAEIFVTRFSSDLSTVIYSTLLGEKGNEWVSDLVVDDSGNALIVGYTSDPAFPNTPGGLADRFSDNVAGFIAKLDATGENLLFSTFLGRALLGAALDSHQDLIVFGRNNGLGFETMPNPLNLGDCEWLVAKINPNGTALLQSGCLETIETYYYGLDLDSQDNVFLTGKSTNPSFPVTSGDPLVIPYGSSKAVVTALTANLSEIMISNWFGAELKDEGLDISVDSTGSMLVAGETESIEFPTSLSGLEALEDRPDNFVLKINQNDCDPPIIYSTTGGDAACSGLPHMLTVNALGPGPKTYQWQRNGVDIPGENQASLYFESVSFADSADTFACVITSPCGMTVASDISFPVEVPASVGSIPDDQVGCIGQPLILEASLAFGNVAQIDFYLDNVLIHSQSNVNSTTHSTIFSERRVGEWRVQIVDTCGSFTAGTFTVSLDEAEVLPRFVSAVQGPGLGLPRFRLDTGCSLIEPSVQWELTPSVPFTLDGNTLVFDEAPTEDVLVQATVDYPEPFPTYEVEGRFIYTANTGVTDVNGDGCNTEADFIALAALWRTMVEADGDGDQIITVLDFPLLPANNPEACP